MPKKAKDFKSESDYKKWLGHGHATGVFEKTPGNTPVKVGGKTKKVSHKKSGK